MIRPTERRLKAMTIAAGALMLGAASAAVGMTATSGGHGGASAAGIGPVSGQLPRTAAPFICLAYAHTWGVCIGPPTS